MIGCGTLSPLVVELITDRHKFFPFQIYEKPTKDKLIDLENELAKSHGGRDFVLYVDKAATLSSVSPLIQKASQDVKVVIFDSASNLVKLKVPLLDMKPLADGTYQKFVVDPVDFNKMLGSLEPVKNLVLASSNEPNNNVSTKQSQSITEETKMTATLNVKDAVQELVNGVEAGQQDAFRDLATKAVLGLVSAADYKAGLKAFDKKDAKGLNALYNNAELNDPWTAYVLVGKYGLSEQQALELTGADAGTYASLNELLPTGDLDFQVPLSKSLLNKVKALKEAPAGDAAEASA